MPTYEYQCQDCSRVFDVFATFKQKTEGLQPVCPQCHSTQVRQAFRSVMVLVGNKGGIPPLPSGGCCPGGPGNCR